MVAVQHWGAFEEYQSGDYAASLNTHSAKSVWGGVGLHTLALQYVTVALTAQRTKHTLLTVEHLEGHRLHREPQHHALSLIEVASITGPGLRINRSEGRLSRMTLQLGSCQPLRQVRNRFQRGRGELGIDRTRTVVRHEPSVTTASWDSSESP